MRFLSSLRALSWTSDSDEVSRVRRSEWGPLVVVEEAEAETETETEAETEAEAEEGIVVSPKKTIPVSCNGHQSSAEERARERKWVTLGRKLEREN